MNFIRGATVIAMAVAIGKWGWFGVIGDALTIAIIVRYAARRHPVKTCPRCHGARTVPSLFIPWAKGPDRYCGGQGAKLRWSSRVIAPDIARQVRARGVRDSY